MFGRPEPYRAVHVCQPSPVTLELTKHSNQIWSSSPKKTIQQHVLFFLVCVSLKTQKCCEKVGSKFSYFVISIFGTHEVTRLTWRLSFQNQNKQTNQTTLEPYVEIEPTTFRLLSECSATKLIWRTRNWWPKSTLYTNVGICYVLIIHVQIKKARPKRELPRRGSHFQPTG